MRILFFFLGRTRRPECRALLDDYVSRIRHYCEMEVSELRNASPLSLRKLKFDPAATLVLLDPAGKQLTSQQFARWLGELRDRGAKEIIFLCGAAEGFPEDFWRHSPAVRGHAHTKISLSTLTLPHEFARVVLAEQLYRAFTILSGHPYPK